MKPETIAVRQTVDGPAEPTDFDLAEEIARIDAAETRRLVATYNYFTADGSPFAVVERYETPSGKKTFWPQGPGRSKLPQGPRPVYGLLDLLDHPDAPVLVVEGEKVADAMRVFLEQRGQLGVVLAWMGGSSAVEKTDWAPLRGRSVTLCPDYDEPGKKCMDTLSGVLALLGCQVRRVEMPADSESGDDFADLLAEDRGDDVLRLIEEAEEVRVPSIFESAESIRTADIPPRVWFLDGMLTAGLALLVGKKGNGKTFFGMQAASAIARGTPFLQRATVQAKVAYGFLELDRTAVHERLGRLGAQPPDFLATFAWPRGDEGVVQAETAFRDHGIRVLFLDMLSGILPLDAESSSYDLSPFLIKWRRLAHQYGACVVFLHHASKATKDDPMDAALGTTALVGQADCFLLLDRKRTEPGGKIFVGGNHGKESLISLRFEDCKWSLSDGPADGSNEPQVAEADKAVLELIRKNPGGAKTKDLAAALGKSEGAIRAALSRLRSKGLVDLLAGHWRAHVPHENARSAQDSEDLF